MAVTKKQISHGFILGVILTLSVIAIIYIFKYMNGLEDFISRLGLWGPLISIILYGILSVSPVPSDPLTVINGAIYGPIWGSLISWFGNNLAAMIEYYLAKNISQIGNFTIEKSKLPFGLNKLPVDSPYLLIFGRTIPQYGGKIISLLAGIYHVPIRRYIWTAAISNLMGSILFALGGFGLANLL